MPRLNLDPSTEFGARVERRPREEWIGWLSTVDPEGTPQPTPVWFLWDGTSLLIYSQPDTPKLRNIGRNPRVSLNLDGDGQGGDIVVLTGDARIDTGAPPANAVADYVAKYRDAMTRIGMTPESFAASYSVAIRITPTRVRGH